MPATKSVVVRVRIRGSAPVLVQAKEPSAWVTPQTGPRVQASQRLHRLDDGRIAWATRDIVVMMSRVAKVRTAILSSLRGRIKAQEKYVPLLIPLSNGSWREAKSKDWKAHVSVAMCKGTRVALSRPRFDRWGLEFKLLLLVDDRITEEVMKQLLEWAGIRIGLGGYNVGRGGSFGCFEVVDWEVVETINPTEIVHTVI